MRDLIKATITYSTEMSYELKTVEIWVQAKDAKALSNLLCKLVPLVKLEGIPRSDQL